MVRDSIAGMFEEARGKDVCAGGGELTLEGGSRVIAIASLLADVLTASSSALFVPDPCPGDNSC